MASRRYGRYLTTDYTGRPRLDAAKVKAAEKFDGKFVVITNDDTLSAEDIALGYKGGWIIDIDQAWGLSRTQGVGGIDLHRGILGGTSVTSKSPRQIGKR